MKIRFQHKLLLALTTIIFIVLLVQGVLSGSMVLEMLEKRAIASLSREAGTKAQLFASIIRECEEDLTILSAHRDNENFFTYRSFDVNDGMVEALSSLELFFMRVHEVKPHYDRIQLLIHGADRPALQLNDGKAVHHYNDFDPDGSLRQSVREQSGSAHRLGQDDQGEPTLISFKALRINDHLEGYLMVRRSIAKPLQTIMQELSQANITAMLQDVQGRQLTATPDFNPDHTPLLQDANSIGAWITVNTPFPVLNWTLMVGMPKSESFTVFRNLFMAALVAIVVLIGIVFYFVRKAIQTLKEYNRILEQQVAQRTIQLEEANQEILQLNLSLKEENLRMGTELEISRQIQQMVLPRPAELTNLHGLDVAAFMEPASEVGGDYYDILHDPDGGLHIAIGDVTGHGLESGVVMLMTQSMVRILINNQEIRSKHRLDRLNRTLFDNLQRMGSNKNLTFALLDYQPPNPESNQSSGLLQLCGQHESILLVRSQGTIEIIDTIDLGFPIALIKDIDPFLQETSLSLQPDDVLVLYTDGITEAVNLKNTLYGLERLSQVVNNHRHLTAKEIQKAVVADVKRHIGTQTLFDDLTLIILKQT